MDAHPNRNAAATEIDGTPVANRLTGSLKLPRSVQTNYGFAIVSQARISRARRKRPNNSTATIIRTIYGIIDICGNHPVVTGVALASSDDEILISSNRVGLHQVQCTHLVSGPCRTVDVQQIAKLCVGTIAGCKGGECHSYHHSKSEQEHGDAFLHR